MPSMVGEAVAPKVVTIKVKGDRLLFPSALKK
jgi:hypothetical protein